MKANELREQDYVLTKNNEKGYIKRLATQVLTSQGEVVVSQWAILRIEEEGECAREVTVLCDDILKVLDKPYHYEVRYLYDGKKQVSKKFKANELDLAQMYHYKTVYGTMNKRYSFVVLCKCNAQGEVLEEVRM